MRDRIKTNTEQDIKTQLQALDLDELNQLKDSLDSGTFNGMSPTPSLNLNVDAPPTAREYLTRPVEGPPPGEAFEATDLIVPAAQLAIGLNPKFQALKLAYQSLAQLPIVFTFASIRDQLEGESFDPVGLGKEAGLEAIINQSLGSVFKLFAPGDNSTVNEFAKRFGLPHVVDDPTNTSNTLKQGILNTAKATTTFGARAVAQQMTKFRDTVTGFIEREIGKNKPVVDLAEALDNLQKGLDRRAGYKELKDIIPGDTQISTIKYESLLDNAISEARSNFADEGFVKKLLAQKDSLAEKGSVRSYDQIDGLISQLDKARDQGNTEIIDTLTNTLYDSIADATGNVPAIRQAAQNKGQDITAFIKSARVNYAEISRIIKSDKTGLLNKIASGRISPANQGLFLKQWSESPQTRNLLKEVAPEVALDLNRAWLARNTSRFVAKESNDVVTLLNNGKGLREFLEPLKDTVVDMFDEDSYQALINFSHYLDSSKFYAGKIPEKNLLESIGKLTISGSPGSVAGTMADRAIGGSGLVGGMVGGAITAGTAELLANRLVIALTDPKSVMNTIFGTPIGKFAADKPSAVLAPIDFEDKETDRPLPKLNLNDN
nr:hypothetical protein [uncultured Mediterranean phage uvMED]BAR29905.1 hypothetical protein [uncultured Mediterranean phage uvMED]BAR29950.1 hypothetical protein [uncultured Mediterranean phage uvMED]